MRLVELALKNFRNIQETSFRPDPKINFIIGSNGQGKTSVLETISYFATLRSFKGSKTDEIIKYHQPFSEITAQIVPDSGDEEWKTELKINFEGNTKTAFINRKPYRSSTAYLSQRFGNFELGFHAVVFNPSDHDLIRGEPSGRRIYLDRVIAAEELEYLKQLQKYQRLLEQRNSLLKEPIKPPSGVLEGFTEPLIELGAWICLKRLEYIERLSKILSGAAKKIAPHQPDLRAIYRSNWAPEIPDLSISNKDLAEIHFTGHYPMPSLEILSQAFRQKLGQTAEAELRSGSTLVGPHRDDWTLTIGAQSLKGHGSQGEIRSGLLALKLCEIELFRKKTGHRPLLLLDDFSSELDQERRRFLLGFLMETDLQTFVTTTEDSVTSGKCFRMIDGKVLAT